MTSPSFSIRAQLEQEESPRQREAIEGVLRLLSECLHEKYKIPLRDDSRLSYEWALKCVKRQHMRDMDQIIEQLWYIYVLYNYTDYQQVAYSYIPLFKFNYMRRHGWFPLARYRMRKYMYDYVLPLIQWQKMFELLESSKKK